jgi:glycosyltransferase involved in cell wall biosynthesis
MTSLVSTIIATFNRSRLVQNAINSVLQQTYSAVEVIVVDDGSTDDTQNILQQYGTKIRVVRQENAGPAAARNHGIQISRGKIITFLDSDDVWLPTYLEAQVRVLQQAGNSIPCSLCNAKLRLRHGETTSFRNALMFPSCVEGIWENPAEVLATRPVLFNQAIAIRREALDRVGLFNPQMRYWVDFDLELRLSLLGPWAFVREPLVIYSGDSEGSLAEESVRNNLVVRQYAIEVRERVLNSLATQDMQVVRDLLRREISQSGRELAATKLANGETLGRRVVGKALLKTARCNRAISRRLPGFPKMKTRSFSEQQSSSSKLRSNKPSQPVATTMMVQDQWD